MNNEIWKDVPEYVGLYQVSTMGRIRGLKRGKILKTDTSRDGYTRVAFCKDGKIRRFRVNRLVALAFIPNPEHLPQVNHKNEIKADNRADNLEWCTPKDNINSGTCIIRRAIKQGKPVICQTTGETFFSVGEAARQTGISVSSVINCCKGRRKDVFGYSFVYAN